MEKRKTTSFTTYRYDEETGIITFTTPRGDICLDLDKVHKANRAHAEIHGWGQRIGDRAALERKDKDGGIIPKDVFENMKFQRMEALCRFYEEGGDQWEMRGGGDGSGGRSLVIEAICRVKDWSYERAEEMVETHAEMHFGGDRKKALAKLATGMRVASAMLDIKRERAAANATEDADAMLDELGGE